MFNALFHLKDDILMLERLRYGTEFGEEQFEYFRKRNPLPETSEELLAQINDFDENWIRSYIPEDVYSMWSHGDHSAYTNEFHYRQFWNEIANDKITQFFLELICKMVSVATACNERTKFSLRLHDFADYDIYFNTQKGAVNFVEQYGVDLATLFERTADGTFKETTIL